jgi:hypothetical protein
MSVVPIVEVHPAGTVTDIAEVDAVLGPDGSGDFDGMGLGVPAGVGLGRSTAVVGVAFLLLSSANAVPQAPITKTRPTTAPTIKTHGVRWTDGCAIPAAGV